MALIPATILTGFLGSGKTTLLNRILREPHGMKIAVIENEFGEENIDNEILVQDSNEQIVEMSNGCICCTVRGDLIAGLSQLAQKRRDGVLQFDRVVIETTGLANPGPVAQTFFMDEEVGVSYLLDGVITVVDASHAMQQLDRFEEAQRQIDFADRMLLSKTDLVSPESVSALETRLKRINPRAPIMRSEFGDAPIDEILDIRGFNLNEKLEIDPDFLKSDEHDHACDEHCAYDYDHHHAHHHTHDHAHAHDHAHGGHTDNISAFVFRSERAFDPAKLEEFIGGLVQSFGPRMLRYKGVLWLDGATRKVIFQGVHQTMGSDLGSPWADGEQRGSKIVFIGQNLPKEVFTQGLTQCLT
ncbi:MAG: CobW family GTP-binding protein [Betaproteobacteria bacterium]